MPQQLIQVVHPLAPLADQNSRVLILGTMPSPASRAAQFYYAHPQNRFWPVLAQVLGEPLPPDAAGRRALALRRGIALWDVVQRCRIAGAADAAIRDAVPNDLEPLLKAAPIGAIFTTGQKAGALYRRLVQPKTGRAAIVLPSPSPANCAVKFDALVEAYRQILPWLDPPPGSFDKDAKEKTGPSAAAKAGQM